MASEVKPKFVLRSDPAAQWTGAQKGPIDFLLTAKRDLDAAKRFFREMLRDEPLLSPGKIGTDGANMSGRELADAPGKVNPI